MNKLFSTGLLEIYNVEKIDSIHQEFNDELQIVVKEFETNTRFQDSKEMYPLFKIFATWESCDESLRKVGRAKTASRNMGPIKYATQWDYVDSRRSTIVFKFENTNSIHYDTTTKFDGRCETVKIIFFAASVEFNLKTLTLKKVYDIMTPYVKKEHSTSKKEIAEKLIRNGNINQDEMAKLNGSLNDIYSEMLEKECLKLIPHERMTAIIIKAHEFFQIHICANCKTPISPRIELLTKKNNTYIRSKKFFGKARMNAKFCTRYHCICEKCLIKRNFERCPECNREFFLDHLLDHKKLVYKAHFIYQSEINASEGPQNELLVSVSIPYHLKQQMQMFHDVQTLIYSEYKANEKEKIENMSDGIWSHYRCRSSLSNRTVHGRMRNEDKKVSFTRLSYVRWDNNMTLLCYLLQPLSLTQRDKYYRITQEELKNHLPSRFQIERIETMKYYPEPGEDSNSDSDGELASGGIIINYQ